MACDHARLALHNAEQAITHPDNDYRSGQSLLARCDTAPVYIGGPGVTTATGYLVPAGQEFGVDDTSDQIHACVDIANDGAILYLFWSGV